jgi:hypothetical protein
MIRQLARWYEEKELADALAAGRPAPADRDLHISGTHQVWRTHPVMLLRFLEETWAYRADPTETPDLAVPDALLYGVVPGLESGLADLLAPIGDSMYGPVVMPRQPAPFDSGKGAKWDHLIYAYLIEASRIVEILRRVVFEYLHGERLEVPSPDTRAWLRATEDLFLRDLPSGSVGAITSSLRPDLAATRRNAYFRFFGIDLNHGRDDGQPQPYLRPLAVNTSFIAVFEDFLREVWIASENFSNTSGTNPKDDAAIANYARDMSDMLRSRRRLGNLGREEFFVVTMLSWFHLTVETDNSVVADLKSTAGSPEERLRKIGERVGLPPHVHAESFFTLAPRMSTLFRQIESGNYSDPANVSVLYANPTGPPNPIRKDMLDIINQWSIATGRDMKARRTTATPRTLATAGRNGARNG